MPDLVVDGADNSPQRLVSLPHHLLSYSGLQLN